MVLNKLWCSGCSAGTQKQTTCPSYTQTHSDTGRLDAALLPSSYFYLHAYHRDMVLPENLLLMPSSDDSNLARIFHSQTIVSYCKQPNRCPGPSLTRSDPEEPRTWVCLILSAQNCRCSCRSSRSTTRPHSFTNSDVRRGSSPKWQISVVCTSP